MDQGAMAGWASLRSVRSEELGGFRTCSYPIAVSASGGLQLGAGPAYPQVLVTCTNCGNTVFFNAAVAGIGVMGAKHQKASGEQNGS